MTDFIDLIGHEGIIRHAVSGLGLSEEEIEDKIQDTYLTVLQYNGVIHNLQGFVWRVARWDAVSMIRKSIRHEELDAMNTRDNPVEWGTTGSGLIGQVGEEQETEPIDPISSPEEQTIAKDYTRKAMGSLTELQQVAVQLVDILGFTFQEGADLLDSSKQSFNRLYHRAKAALERYKCSPF